MMATELIIALLFKTSDHTDLSILQLCRIPNWIQCPKAEVLKLSWSVAPLSRCFWHMLSA